MRKLFCRNLLVYLCVYLCLLWLPSSLLAATTYTVTIGWNVSSSPAAQVAGYNVYKGTSVSGPFTKLNTALVTGLTFADPGNSANASACYTVTTFGTNNIESAQATPVCANLSAPNAPGTISVTVTVVITP